MSDNIRTTQVRPTTEGWTQQLDTAGRPLLQFASPRRKQPEKHLADLDLAARKARAIELGVPAFRATQLSTHYFSHYTTDPSAMTDLPAEGREDLVSAMMPPLLTELRQLGTDGGDTLKFLWKLFDGALVESVLMRYPGRITLCVSSQAGCGMNCPFCATGQAGLTRNLSSAEILDQIVQANRAIAAGKLGGPSRASGTQKGDAERVTNIVFMGMGEPLANYNRVVAAVRRMIEPAPHGLGMSQRNIVVSTVGLVPAIKKLTEEDLQVTLALSLHAPDDELRNTLVPVNTRWPVSEVLSAAFAYTKRTGRRLSIEYAMIKDVNDQPFRADLLAKRLKGKLVHVNLIPLNPTPGSEWDASPKPVEKEFVRRLRAAGIATTVRDTRGREIAGACGQLSAAEAAV